MASQSRSARLFWPLPVSQDAPFRARKSSGFVEISTNQGVAPAASCRMLTFEIDFADSRGAAILSRAIFQGHLRGPNAPFRARKGSGFVEISTNQGVASAELSRMLTFEIRGYCRGHNLRLLSGRPRSRFLSNICVLEHRRGVLQILQTFQTFRVDLRGGKILPKRQS